MYSFGIIYTNKLQIVPDDQYSLDIVAVKSHWTIFSSLGKRWVGAIAFFCILEWIDQI